MTFDVVSDFHLSVVAYILFATAQCGQGRPELLCPLSASTERHAATDYQRKIPGFLEKLHSSDVVSSLVDQTARPPSIAKEKKTLFEAM